jgi:hypothetical protein
VLNRVWIWRIERPVLDPSEAFLFDELHWMFSAMKASSVPFVERYCLSSGLEVGPREESECSFLLYTSF